MERQDYFNEEEQVGLQALDDYIYYNLYLPFLHLLARRRYLRLRMTDDPVSIAACVSWPIF